MKLLKLKKLLLPIVLPLALLAGQAQAAYIERFNQIAPGAMTFTGNAIGLDYLRPNANTPPGAGQAGAQSMGAFIQEGGTGQYGTHPIGTTGAWTNNRSGAVLRIPAGATVLHAELIWGGTSANGSQTALTTAQKNSAVEFITPAGSSSITPNAATSQEGTATATYYVRSQNVTDIVKNLGAGNIPISVGKIPALNGGSAQGSGADPSGLNSGGWTLAVAYRSLSMPEQKLAIYVGAEAISGTSSATQPISNFCTAPAGAQSGRLMVSAFEGDAGIAGDYLRFGGTNPATNNLGGAGTNNATTNFFAAQINGDSGLLDTSGTFGTLNKTPGSSNGPGRHGYDIANVPLDSFLTPGMTSAYATAGSTGDAYMVNALGIQIKVGQPSFPTAVKTVDKTVAKVGDELLYTITLDNTTGTAQATNVRFFDSIPPGTTFVAGSFTQGGTAVPAANPTLAAGVSLPNIATGSSLVVTFKARVSSVPARPAPASYVNSARWTYDYVPCAGQPTISSEKITNPVTTTIARLAASKTVSPAGTQNAGSTLTYTITMTNDGLANSSGSTLVDAIPAGATYVAGSTKLNGVAVADNAGAMPFATAAAINSPGQAVGVLAVGASATVEFQFTINGNATGNIVNSATGDIDGAGASSDAPVSTPPVSTAVQPVANVAITKSNGSTSVISGNTTTYTIQVSNTGPSPANNTVVRDPLATGLSCTAVTCPPAGLTGGATCPTTLNIATLQGTGVTIPSLPANSSINLEVTCTVTATGL